ncbi:hypothetical protein G7Y89_g6000 [Cudoniella acicularis]|uniref:Pentacotripeptide-repeat region of PRORP domain-containing protein n=1 Tax=Cudoniella acicularis TaxID=354080 RepID=A0A8H4RNR1_9HELO|nr:hypothetical protein G7Y89_g6000 [Cudoniella acicularis]
MDATRESLLAPCIGAFSAHATFGLMSDPNLRLEKSFVTDGFLKIFPSHSSVAFCRMLSCSACIERCLQTLIGDSATASPSIRNVVASNIRRDSFSRRFGSTSNSSISRRPDASSDHARPSRPSWSGHRFNPSGIREIGTERLLETRGARVSNREFKLEKSMGRILEKHPAYANDPLKLAEYVRKALRGDDFETALAVVRAASKDLSCTVSWNHLMDWQLTKGRMNAALKTYNEMKKRGQMPDAHTFTIIIRGCTEHKDLSAALGKVLAIYNSMLTDKSPVKPNVIHLNAVLKMCGRAKDMDAMFGVVAQMPPRGISAPNNLTFTTIFNALRMNEATNLRSNLSPLQIRQNSRKTMINARHIWKDITTRWRQGDIWIDEELVCSMGRLMLIGEKQDWDDILSLIEQTMNIPRQVPRLGTQDRKMIEPSSQGRDELDRAVVSEENPENSVETSELTNVDQFKSITPPKPPTAGASAYAKPGRNSLSLVLEAVFKLRLKEPADKYWNIFVEQIGVKPDIDNFHSYLRYSTPGHDAGTFKIAISACSRDSRNFHAFANAGKVLDIMTTALEAPSVPVLTAYLDIAISSTNEPNGVSKQVQGKRILRALERLNPSFLNLKSLLQQTSSRESEMTAREKEEFEDSVLLLMRRMIAAYDLLMDKALVDRAQYSELTQHRSKLTAFVNRHKNKKGEATSKIFDLPPHLLQHVMDHQLNKIMGRAQVSPEKWYQFRERLEKEYQSQQQQAAQAVEMMQENTSRAREAEGRLWGVPKK